MDNLNIAAGSDVNQKEGRDVMQRVGNNVNSLAVAKQLLRVKMAVRCGWVVRPKTF